MEAKQAHRIMAPKHDLRAELEQDEKSWQAEIEDLEANDELDNGDKRYDEAAWLFGEKRAEDGEELWKQTEEDTLWGWEE